MKTSHRTTIAIGVFLAVAFFSILFGIGTVTTEDVEETVFSNVMTMTEHMPRICVYWHAWEDIIFASEDAEIETADLPPGLVYTR